MVNTNGQLDVALGPTRPARAGCGRGDSPAVARTCLWRWHRGYSGSGAPGFLLAAIAAYLREVRGSLNGFASADPVVDARAVFSWS
jgi:hypothetical protein